MLMGTELLLTVFAHGGHRMSLTCCFRSLGDNSYSRERRRAEHVGISDRISFLIDMWRYVAVNKKVRWYRSKVAWMFLHTYTNRDALHRLYGGAYQWSSRKYLTIEWWPRETKPYRRTREHFHFFHTPCRCDLVSIGLFEFEIWTITRNPPAEHYRAGWYFCIRLITSA